MNLGQLQFGTAFRLLIRTTPLLFIRLGAYIAFWLLLLVGLVMVGGLAYLLGQLWPPLSFLVILGGFIAILPLYRLAHRYVFYLLKAAHIAIIVEYLTNDGLPPGVGQLEWGRRQVTERFGQVSIMFIVDQLVTAAVRAFTNTVVRVASWLPGESFQTLAKIVARVVYYATTYIDEAIMARSFWRRDETIWESAEEGVVLYGQVWKALVLNAVALMVLSYIPFVLVAIILSGPVALLLGSISPMLAGWSVLIVLLLSFFIKVAVGDSFAMIAMIASYHRETANLKPDPAMEARIAGISDKFGELKRRALGDRSTGGQTVSSGG